MLPRAAGFPARGQGALSRARQPLPAPLCPPPKCSISSPDPQGLGSAASVSRSPHVPINLTARHFA